MKCEMHLFRLICVFSCLQNIPRIGKRKMIFVYNMWLAFWAYTVHNTKIVWEKIINTKTRRKKMKKKKKQRNVTRAWTFWSGWPGFEKWSMWLYCVCFVCVSRTWQIWTMLRWRILLSFTYYFDNEINKIYIYHFSINF